MTKTLNITCSNIQKCKDKKFIFEIYENIISSLFDYDCISNLYFNKTKESFAINFDMKVCKTADILWILVKEWLNCIAETENEAEISIIEFEDSKEKGIIYNIRSFIYSKGLASITA